MLLHTRKDTFVWHWLRIVNLIMGSVYLILCAAEKERDSEIVRCATGVIEKGKSLFKITHHMYNRARTIYVSLVCVLQAHKIKHFTLITIIRRH
jgi:hypothetical protein